MNTVTHLVEYIGFVNVFLEVDTGLNDSCCVRALRKGGVPVRGPDEAAVVEAVDGEGRARDLRVGEFGRPRRDLKHDSPN